uniref:Uncharacterized protein n=1 Tax=Manihot esculenta TaxID=3983 RepID=A0A199UB03_MANES
MILINKAVFSLCDGKFFLSNLDFHLNEVFFHFSMKMGENFPLTMRVPPFLSHSNKWGLFLCFLIFFLAFLCCI